jgi:hypothetical protein
MFDPSDSRRRNTRHGSAIASSPLYLVSADVLKTDRDPMPDRSARLLVTGIVDATISKRVEVGTLASAPTSASAPTFRCIVRSRRHLHDGSDCSASRVVDARCGWDHSVIGRAKPTHVIRARARDATATDRGRKSRVRGLRPPAEARRQRRTAQPEARVKRNAGLLGRLRQEYDADLSISLALVTR